MRVFSETQRFNQWWIKLIFLALLAFLFYALFKWYILNENVGNVTNQDSVGQLIVILTTLLFFLLFYFLKLQTEIDESGIHFQFSPFQLSPKNIPWTDMEECYVRTYRPIAEYGGWGYRSSFGKSKAFNVKGNKGIQIKLKSGKKLLIGTQKENEAQQVIDRYFKGNYEGI